MLDEITRWIQSQTVARGAAAPSMVEYLCVNGSVQGGTTTLLAFTDGRDKPACVVKVHRRADARRLALNEADVLRGFDRGDEFISSSIPQLLWCGEIGSFWVLAESVLEGKPMAARMAVDGRPLLKQAKENVRLATEWLAAFTRRQLLAAAGGAGQESRLFEDFGRIFSWRQPERNFLEECRNALEGITAAEHPRCVSHGDFCRHNFLVSGTGRSAKISVIDWTFAQRDVLLMHDLFFFLATYFLQIRSQPGLTGYCRAFRESFLERNAYSDCLADAVKSYCREFGIAVGQARWYFAAFLVRQALLEYGQTVSCWQSGVLPRFTLYLSAQSGSAPQEALRENLWAYFFRELAAEPAAFALT